MPVYMCKNISEYPYNYYIYTDTYVTDRNPTRI